MLHADDLAALRAVHAGWLRDIKPDPFAAKRRGVRPPAPEKSADDAALALLGAAPARVYTFATRKPKEPPRPRVRLERLPRPPKEPRIRIPKPPKTPRIAGPLPKSGTHGITWHRSSNKWIAMLHVNKTNIYVGTSPDLGECRTMLERARVEHPPKSEQAA
jgi:hypothetical protein